MIFNPVLIFTITNAILIYGSYQRWTVFEEGSDRSVYFWNGLYGAFCGITSGSIGICMSKSTDEPPIKSLYSSFIVSVTIGSFCCFIGLGLTFLTIIRFQENSKDLFKTTYVEFMLLIGESRIFMILH